MENNLREKFKQSLRQLIDRYALLGIGEYELFEVVYEVENEYI